MHNVRKLAAGTVPLLAAAIGLTAAPGSADVPALDRQFVATAEANGARLQYGIPGFLAVEQYLDAGGPTSHAVLGNQTSQSFASWPYPGSTVAGYAGLAYTVFGVTPPGYPFYASASDPTQPEDKVGDPNLGLSLTAAAVPDHATGTAVVGGPQNSDVTGFLGRSLADVQIADETVTAAAESLAKAVTVGPLSIASVTSKATTRYGRGTPQPVSQTELVLEGGRIGAVSFRYGPDGLAVSDQGIPIPAADGLEHINQALAPSGFSVQLTDAQPASGGVVAAAFVIVGTAPVPGAGTGVFRMELGGAAASIALGVPSTLPNLDPVAVSGDVSAPPVAEPSGVPGAEPGFFSPSPGSGTGPDGSSSLSMGARPHEAAEFPAVEGTPTEAPTADSAAAPPPEQVSLAASTPNEPAPFAIRDYRGVKELSLIFLAFGVGAAASLVGWGLARKRSRSA